MNAAPTLFDSVAPCPATREAIAQYHPTACPLCGAPAGDHYPEAADVIRDVGEHDFAAWMLSLPRKPR